MATADWLQELSSSWAYELLSSWVVLPMKTYHAPMSPSSGVENPSTSYRIGPPTNCKNTPQHTHTHNVRFPEIPLQIPPEIPPKYENRILGVFFRSFAVGKFTPMPPSSGELTYYYVLQSQLCDIIVFRRAHMQAPRWHKS